MDVTIILIAIVIFLLTRYAWDYFSQPDKQPNGPWQFPIFGHLLNIKRNPNWYKDLTLYRKQYGDVIRLRFGAHNAVILHGMDRIKEAFSDKADYFSEGPDYQVLVKMFIGKNGRFSINMQTRISCAPFPCPHIFLNFERKYKMIAEF